MMLREVRRAALFQDIVWKLLGQIKVEDIITDSVSINVPKSIVQEAQELLNDPLCEGRYGKTAKGS